MKIHELAKEFAEVARESPDLVQRKYRGEKGSLRGHCYTLSEALWYEEGKGERWNPAYLNHSSWPKGLKPGQTHWFLRRPQYTETEWRLEYGIFLYDICDPSAEQFDIDIPYGSATSCGFQTKGPSKRAKDLIVRVKHIRAFKKIEDEVWDSTGDAR